MNDFTQFGGAAGFADSQSSRLARWLQQVMQPSLLNDTNDTDKRENAEERPVPPTYHTHDSRSYRTTAYTPYKEEHSLDLVLNGDYHLAYYQQLPDFIMALLQGDPEATLRYASVLYHMLSCNECHSAYLDLYDALSAAVQPESMRVSLGQGTRTLEATPPRMLAHLCQTLISQAEAILRQARHDHVDRDVAAREQLQLALRVSSRIAQSNVRKQALHDLVRVATLFEGPVAPKEEEPGVYAYTPTFAGAGGMRRGGRRITRRADTLARANEQPMIDLQAQALEGNVTQSGQTLELHLQDLDETLRGRPISVSILLGSLLEPVRWRGGNPLAIRSTGAVDATGSLVMSLGETDLQLNNPEERNLLEAMFMLLEVRAVD